MKHQFEYERSAHKVFDTTYIFRCKVCGIRATSVKFDPLMDNLSYDDSKLCVKREENSVINKPVKS